MLVLDFDGTIAVADQLDSRVRTAIATARAQGLLVVLATGRILRDLESVCGELSWVDAVVAENGGVLAFPADARTHVIGRPPQPEFLAALTQRHIRFAAGQCVVEADASDAPALLALIRELELPLILTFNRSRVMVLPNGVSKAGGLHEALRLLHRSEHNAVAIGDAENDHTMLAACELGVAVSWGSVTLQARADDVLRGTGPEAVAEYIRSLATLREVPPPRHPHRRLVLGETESGEPVTLALAGRNVVITGDARSGKSYVAGLLAEQLIAQRYAVCVIDPEGDYRTLEDLSGVVLLGGRALPDYDHIQRLLHHPELSLVLDLSAVPLDAKRRYLAGLFPRLIVQRRQRGIPHRIILDEGQYFLDRRSDAGPLDWELGGYIVVSYRPADLERIVLETSPVLISTQLTDASPLRSVLAGEGPDGPPARWESTLAGLTVGEALVLRHGAADTGVSEPCRLAPRTTAHVRHRQKYLETSVPDPLAFVFTHHGTPTGDRARSLEDLVSLLHRASAEVLEGHLARRDFSRWLRDVFGDAVLALQVREVETLGDGGPEARAAEVARRIETRYGD